MGDVINLERYFMYLDVYRKGFLTDNAAYLVAEQLSFCLGVEDRNKIAHNLLEDRKKKTFD